MARLRVRSCSQAVSRHIVCMKVHEPHSPHHDLRRCRLLSCSHCARDPSPPPEHPQVADLPSQTADAAALVAARDVEYGGTVLHWAAAAGDEEICRLLLLKGADTRVWEPATVSC